MHPSRWLGGAVILVTQVATVAAFALDKQGSAHGGQVGGSHTEFNVSGSAMLGASLFFGDRDLAFNEEIRIDVLFDCQHGVEKPLLRADYAFNAVQLEAGESNIKFYYDPLSFKLGALITFLSLVAGLVLLNRGRLARWWSRIRGH